MDLLIIQDYMVLAIGVVANLIGIGAVLQPQKMSEKFGIPAKEPEAGYVLALGIRDVFVGGVFLVLYFYQIREAVAPLSVLLGVVAVADAYTVFRFGIKKLAVIHLAGAVVSFAFAGFCFFFVR